MADALLDGTVTDQNDVPVAGALVYVYDGRGESGGLSALRDSLGQDIANPVTSDEDGYWSAYADSDQFCTLVYYWGGRKRYVEANVLLGTSAINTDPNLRIDLASPASGKGAELVGYKNPLGGPALTRLTRSRLGETVSALDYVVGDGSADDTAAYQALINLQPAEIVYPQGCEIAVTSQILWVGDMTHRFHGDAGITADVAAVGQVGAGVVGLGYPDLLSLTASGAIARNAVFFTTTSSPTAAGLAIGDDFYLHDSVTDEYDINSVRAISGNTIYTKRPINYNFATATNIQVYKLANACRNVKVFGGTIRNVNTGTNAGGLQFLNATDIYLDGLTVRDTGALGCQLGLALRCAAVGVTAINTGSVGFGCRNFKDGYIRDYTGRYPNNDESLTFYKNVTHVDVYNVDIEQYVATEAPAGNEGNAGNCILVDDRGTDIRFNGVRTRGSGTYSVFVTNSSERVSIDNFDLAQGSLGGIRLGPGVKDCTVGRGRITDVISPTDSEQSGIASAAIQDETGATGNVLGTNVTFARIASNINIRQRGTPGSVVTYGDQEFRGGKLSVETSDWDGTATGSRIGLRTASATGSTYGRLFAEIGGGTDFGAIAITARSTAQALTVPGEVSWHIPTADNKPYISWVDFSSGFHTGAAPLGAQSAAQADSTAPDLATLKADFNAFLAKLRSAKLLAP